MSTVGLKTSDAASGAAPREELAARGVRVPWMVRWLDLIVLALALPVFIVAELPIAGYLVGGGAWIAQRAVQAALARQAATSEDPRTIVGFTVASMILRGWLVALSIFLVGLGDNDAGLAAAELVISLFTVYFAMQMALRPMEAPR